MMSKLQGSNKVIGLKQSKKAIKEELASVVFIASDAESRVTEPIAMLCHEHGVEIVTVETMHMLGKACGIEVGAAVAVLLK